MSLEAETGSDDVSEDIGLWEDGDAPELDEIAEDLSPEGAEPEEGPSLEAADEPEAETSEQPVEDEETVEASEEKADEESEDQTKEPSESEEHSEPVLEFMGESYGTTEEAEKALTAFEEKANSWEGRISKVQNELEDFRERDRAASEWMQDAYRENKRLVDKVNDLESGTATAPEGDMTTVALPTGKLSDVVDEKVVEDLIEYAQSKGADVSQVVSKYYNQKMGEAVEARFAAIEERDATRTADSENRAMEDRAQVELFTWGSKQQTEDGKLEYPELNSESDQYSEQFARDTFSAWYDLLQESPEFAYSAKGLKFAVNEVRAQTSEGDRETPRDLPADEPVTALVEKVQERQRTTRRANVEASSSSNSRQKASPVSKGKRVTEEDPFEAMARAAPNVVIDGEDLGFDAV